MRPRIAVLAHAADRTGPPMYLVQLLRNLPRHDLDLHVVLLRGGELLDDLQALADVRVVGEPVDPQRANPIRLAEEPARILARRAQLADLTDLDLVVVNTAWSIHALAWLPPPRRIVSIVHELSAGVRELLGPDQLASLLRSDRFVAGCRAVHTMLTDDLHVPAERVDLVPYGIDLAVDRAPAPRAALAATPEQFVVVAAAVPDHRKAPDLFVLLAACAVARRPDIDWAFRWIGAPDAADPRLATALADRAMLDLEETVRFLPPTAELGAHLGAADAFALPSRQDAFPLAAVEAAAAGLPIVAFATGGIAELVADDAGAIVPFGGLAATVDVLARWHDHPAERLAAGRAGAARVRRSHDAADHAARLATAIGWPSA